MKKKRLSKKQAGELRKAAIANFVCPKCGNKGAGFARREAVVIDYLYNPATNEWRSHDSSSIDCWGYQPPENDCLLVCCACDQPLKGVDMRFIPESFDEFMRDLTNRYIEYRDKQTELEAELAQQRNEGFTL